MNGRLGFAIAGVIVGLVAGFFVANSLNRQAVTTQNPGPLTVPEGFAGPAEPSGMRGDVPATLQNAETEPTNFVAQMQAGDMYSQIGRFDKAVEFYEKGIALNPSNLQANIVLANAYFDSQKFEQAEKYYSRALEIDPRNVDARTDLGSTYIERSTPDYDRAVAEFGQALEIDPNSSPTLYYLAIAHLRRGERAEAERILADLEKKDGQTELVKRLRENINAKVPTQ